MELIEWKSQGESRSVERAPAPSDEGLRQRLLRPRPVVFEGLATRMTDLGLGSLRSRFGRRRVPLIRVRDGILGYGQDRGMEYDERELGDFLATLDDPRPTHFMTVPTKAHFPELWDEIRPPDCCARAPWRDSRVNVGTSGVTTPIHVELTHNFLAVVSGEKEVCLFPPRDTAKLYFTPFSGAPHISPVSPHALDERRHPRALRLRPWRAVARTGDVVFIPRGWWHTVATHGPTLAVASWWADGPWALVPLAAERYKRLRGFRT